MALLLSWVLMIALPMLARGEYDATFCRNGLPSPGANRPYLLALTMPFDGMFVSEVKKESTVSYINSHYYSHYLRIIKSITTTPTETTFYYTDASLGDREAFFANSTCNVETPNDQNDFKHTIRKIADGFYLIGLANEMVEWASSANVLVRARVFKEYTTYRGIPTAHWYTCNYDTVKNRTAVIEWMITDYRSISVSGFIYPRLALYKKSTYNDNTTEVTDYSLTQHLNRRQLMNIMARPKNSFCPDEKLHEPLPKLPTYMSFTGESTQVSKDTTKVTLLREVYDFDNSLFFLSELGVAADGDNEEEVKRVTVNDFNTGVSYIVNQNLAGCQLANTILEDRSDIADSAGFVRMRTPKEFFNLNTTTYKYSGLREVRGLQCQTWTARMDNTIYVWSFMTVGQMKALNYREDAYRVPVALDTYKNGVHTVFNIFEFRTERETIAPFSLVPCYESDNPVVVRITVDGTFDSIVQHNGFNSFRAAFFKSLLVMGNIGTPLRIHNIDIQENTDDKSETLVQFRIFERYDQGEDILGPDRDTMKTEEVLNMLQNNIDNGNFLVGVTYPDSNSKQLEIKKGTLMVQDEYGKFQSYGSYKTAASRSNPFSGPRRGYSGGSLTGLAIGMIVLGLVVGVGAVYAFKRYQKSRGIAGEFSMSSLSNEADA